MKYRWSMTNFHLLTQQFGSKKLRATQGLFNPSIHPLFSKSWKFLFHCLFLQTYCSDGAGGHMFSALFQLQLKPPIRSILVGIGLDLLSTIPV